MVEVAVKPTEATCTVTVRWLEEATIRGLKIRAATNNRSMEAEIRVILADAARQSVRSA